MQSYNTIPTSKAARLGVASKVAAKTSIKNLVHKGKKALGRTTSKSETEFKKEVSSELFHSLTYLRGTALKIAQILSLETNLFSEEFQKELSKSCYQVPPLNKSIVRKVFLNELNKAPEKVFDKFEEKAFAAASIGQVHSAVESDNDLAVKVQYPGISKTIESDIKLVRTLFKRVPQKQFNPDTLDSLLDEIEERLYEEVNYENEIQVTNFFRENNLIEGVKIPKTYIDYSGKTILTSEKIKGFHLDEWLETNPNQNEKNQIAQKILDFHIHSFRDLKRVHADPNPGNYLFLTNGDLGIIDFGCTRTITERYIQTQKIRMNHFLNGDYEAAWNQLVDSGRAEGPVPEKIRIQMELAKLRTKDKTFDFKKHPNYVNTLVDSLIYIKGIKETTGSALFYLRGLIGIFRICEQLGAEIEIRKYWI